MSSYMKKWLGVPRCLTNISLYGKGILELPTMSLTEEFKCSKVRLLMTLKDSKDQSIRLNWSEMDTIRCGPACHVSSEA